jgi:hypothetical protein
MIVHALTANRAGWVPGALLNTPPLPVLLMMLALFSVANEALE